MVRRSDAATLRTSDAHPRARIVIDDDPRGHIPVHPMSMIAVCGAKPKQRWRQHVPGEPFCDACTELQSGERPRER
jgi:hypothetical protein